VLGLADAAHAEYGADPETALITPIACAILDDDAGPRLKGKQRVRLTPGSLATRVYGSTEIAAEFHCRNELNRRYQVLFERSDLRVVGAGDEGEARVVELPGARFFIATLFLPQMAVREGEPIQLIDAFVGAALIASRART
jgi:CTP synthase (UTP-ammonia lyase)